MGKLLRLNGVTLTDAQAPRIILRDEIETHGSLFLFDGAHEFAEFSGVPAQTAYIPNALSNLTAELTAASGNDLSFYVETRSTDGANGITERTGKGGIHSILTQAGGQAAAFEYRIRAPAAVRAWMYANLTHQFYVSMWSRVTRKGISTGNTTPQSPMHYTNVASATGSHLFHFQAGTGTPATGATYRGSRNDPLLHNFNNSLSTPVNRFASLGVSGVTGPGPSAAHYPYIANGTSWAWASTNFNKCPSLVIYRAYIEDLTVSGRTYAEVEALDYALWQAAFGVGGKFADDTYTDPATLP